MAWAWITIFAITAGSLVLGLMLGYVCRVANREAKKRASLVSHVTATAIALACIAIFLLVPTYAITLNVESLAVAGDPKMIGIAFMAAELCGLLITLWWRQPKTPLD